MVENVIQTGANNGYQNYLSFYLNVFKSLCFQVIQNQGCIVKG